jgi:MFS transporter, DHA2 family, multidrug resistance protein
MSDAAQALPLEQARWVPKFNPWLIGVAVALAAFMEILDTSIANVALPYIGGGLGVSNDDSTWVLTSYLVSNAIVLPISGWLAVRFGRKRFFMACLAIFTLSSVLCGMATSFGLLLLFRALQGAGGGGLQPMAQAILADTFPPEKRGLAFALYGITAVVAPTVGPTLGGWITFNYSWRWIFLINLPVGALTLVLVYHLIEDPPYIGRLKAAGVRLDYIGIALLALGIGALQVVLDRGQEDDWFGSHRIVTLVLVSSVCLVSLVVWEWYSEHPIIEVRLFKNFNYLSSNLMMFTFGILLFSSLVMMPLFLQTLLGYTAELAGLVLSGGAAVVLIAMPVVGQLTTRFQVRYIIGLGWLCLALGMYYSTQRMDLTISFGFASWVRIVQVVGIGFLFVPITMAAYIGMPAEKSNSVAGMINFMRNIGSSVGTSIVTTLIDRRSEYHQSVLVGHTAPGIQNFQNLVDRARQLFIRSGMSPPDALHRAYASVYQAVQVQSATLAYIDTFMVLAVISAIMFVLSFLLKKNDPGGGGEVAVG